MICTLVGALITFFHLFNIDDIDTAFPIKQRSIVSHPQAIAVLVTNQRLDLLHVGRVSQFLCGIINFHLVVSGDFVQLLNRLARPVDCIHAAPLAIEQL